MEFEKELNNSHISIDSASSPNYEKLNDAFQDQNLYSSLNNSINFYPTEERKKKLKKKYIICNHCHSSAKIKLLFNNLIHVKCNCRKLGNLRINDFIDNYINHEKKEINDYLCCKEHKSQKYISYCLDCKLNLCEKCLTTSKYHENHLLENILNVESHLNEIKELIKKNRKKLSKGDIENRKILNIFENMVKLYNDYPSHNLYKSLFFAKEFLNKMNIPEITKKIKIFSKEELYGNVNNSSLITSIKINYNNFNDLSIFKQLDLHNLQKLQLQGNEISNIEPLLYCDLKKLKFLDLENNKLNDESVKDFDKLKFGDIRYINLFDNQIKSPSIFEKVINYKSLKTFFVGKNKFDEKEINKNMNKEYHLEQLKKIGITGNFTDKTIDFVKNLKFSSKLKIMYISRNNLSSLKFLKDVNCSNLEEFWSINNNIKDYNDILLLRHKNNIKNINLKGNKIKKIDDLLNFIEKFPNLEELTLLDNPINIEKPNYKKIIREITSKNINIII